jgi:hypothetical protein
MTQVISIILILFLLRQFFLFVRDKELIFAVIQGFIVGALYDVEEDGEDKFYTIQICLGFVTINILWEN